MRNTAEAVYATDLLIIPKFLETPKDETLDLDRRNLATLRRLSR